MKNPAPAPTVPQEVFDELKRKYEHVSRLYEAKDKQSDGQIATARQKQAEIDELRREHAKALSVEIKSRQRAEMIYDQHRNAVLAYFMAVANPVTAADAQKIVELQQTITGIQIPRESAAPDPHLQRNW